ncbi:hypothetical protein ACFLUO_07425 [Chloroflexota bacterium]
MSTGTSTKGPMTAANACPEFHDTKIVEGLYQHFIQKVTEFDNAAQWIIVDNEPPSIAEDYIGVRFTRDKNNPPYGLIDDEVD